jgi:hypothetical protein
MVPKLLVQKKIARKVVYVTLKRKTAKVVNARSRRLNHLVVLNKMALYGPFYWHIS